jgi:Cytidine and deoxycytidylate deaminase zinc-binding region
MSTWFKPAYDGERVDWERAYLNQCYEIAEAYATCVKAKVGAQVRCPRGLLFGQGYNHSPNPDCNDCANLCAGDIRKGVKSGTRLELCHAVHAEQWAIHQAGERAKGAILYVASLDENGKPRLKDSSLPLGHPMHGFYCSMCARACWMAGISLIITDGVNGIVKFTPEEIWKTSYGVAGSI